MQFFSRFALAALLLGAGVPAVSLISSVEASAGGGHPDKGGARYIEKTVTINSAGLNVTIAGPRCLVENAEELLNVSLKKKKQLKLARCPNSDLAQSANLDISPSRNFTANKTVFSNVVDPQHNNKTYKVRFISNGPCGPSAQIACFNAGSKAYIRSTPKR